MNDQNDELNDILKEAHSGIKPPDSWQDLRTRIDERMKNADTSPALVTKLNGNIVFWRRMALAAAACLVITSALLVYIIYDNINSNQYINYANKNYLPEQNHLQQLNEAFSQVRELFENKCPWIVVGSEGKSEIGIDNNIIKTTNDNKIIVMRLTINTEGAQPQQRYLDIVTFSNQLVSFDMPVAENSNMSITLKPVITNNGRIKIEINTQLDSGSKTKNTVTVADDSFKSLARVKANGNWININATGQPFSNIL